MLNIEVLREAIEQYGRERNIKGFSNMIVALSNETSIAYPNLYKIIRNKSCNLKSLIALCLALNLEPNDLVVLEEM